VKVAIIGTHGIGKTTLSYMIAAEGKKRGFSIALVSEVARESPFPLNDEFTIDSAQWIITSQISRELEAKAASPSYIICDRSAFDPVCYLNAGDHSQRSFEKLRWYAEEWMKTYDRIFFVIPSDNPILNDGFRSLDRDFQTRVHCEFWKIFKSLNNIKMTQICANDIFSNNLDAIYERIFDE
jgi:nicotinamide riboside kinase